MQQDLKWLFFTPVIFIVRKKTDAKYIGRESTDVSDVFWKGGTSGQSEYGRVSSSNDSG